MVNIGTRRASLAVVTLFTLIAPAAGRGDAPSEPPKTGLTPDEVSAGWISLFDGKTLYGWKANSDLNWSARDGVIRADQGHPGLLLTTFQLADYEIRCDYRLQKGGNSGIFLRTPFAPKNPATDCYELNMCDSHPAFPTGSIVGRKKVRTLIEGDGRWMTIVVRVEGPRIQASFNSVPAIDFVETSAAARRTGFIGLQMNGGAVEFRNIALRPLATLPLFNGRSLDGWHIVPGSKSHFQVADRSIHVTNGPGFLESDSSFDDFALQFQARTNGKRLNSGIFFRSMPATAREPSNGYELQIHNGFKNGNRADPVDAGTGAIYRRTKARWVIPDDGQWFTSTLIADGDHFSAWVDGVQVTDWTDTRPPDANPRRGRRTDAGSLLLQAHDPTTDLNFRDIRVGVIPRG